MLFKKAIIFKKEKHIYLHNCNCLQLKFTALYNLFIINK